METGKKSQLDNPAKANTSTSKNKRSKRFYEVSGPLGVKLVRARTHDEARGVYKALHNSSRLCSSELNLDAVTILSESDSPRRPYLVIGGKRKGVFVALRYPKAV